MGGEQGTHVQGSCVQAELGQARPGQARPWPTKPTQNQATPRHNARGGVDERPLAGDHMEAQARHARAAGWRTRGSHTEQEAVHHVALDPRRWDRDQREAFLRGQ